MAEKSKIDGTKLATAIATMQALVDWQGDRLMEWFEEEGMNQFFEWQKRKLDG